MVTGLRPSAVFLAFPACLPSQVVEVQVDAATTFVSLANTRSPLSVCSSTAFSLAPQRLDRRDVTRPT
jgi:hypothetical protein